MPIGVRCNILILSIVLLFSVSVFAGPPDKSTPAPDRVPEIDEDSLNYEIQIITGRVDSLLSEIDTLRNFEFDLEDLPELPAYQEIIIDENGIIKVLTDSGLVIISGDSLPQIDHPLIIDERDYRRGELTEFGKDIIIDEGERVNSDITLISGDVTVNGTVDGDVVVVAGDIYVNSTGYIRGDATSVGGRVKKEEGSKVTGATVSINLPIMVLPRGSWMQVFEGILIIIMIISIFFSALAISLFPKPVRRITSQLAAHPIKSFFFGYLLYFAAFLVWLLLLVSVIGIPLAILGQPIAMLILVIFGYVATNVILGEKFFKSTSPISSFFLGSLITTAIPLILLILGYVTNLLVFFILNATLLGILLFVLLPFGLGAATLARFGLPRRKKNTDEDGEHEISIQISTGNE